MQSVEMIPFGLLAGFVDDKEVRITEISTESFCFRVREQVERPRHIRIGFYDLSESMYREVELESYHFMEKRQEQWYVSYTVEVFQRDYVQAVQKLFREYTGYIRARIEGTDGDGTDHLQLSCESGRDPCKEYGRAEIHLVFRRADPAGGTGHGTRAGTRPKNMV